MELNYSEPINSEHKAKTENFAIHINLNIKKDLVFEYGIFDMLDQKQLILLDTFHNICRKEIITNPRLVYWKLFKHLTNLKSPDFTTEIDYPIQKELSRDLKRFKDQMQINKKELNKILDPSDLNEKKELESKMKSLYLFIEQNKKTESCFYVTIVKKYNYNTNTELMVAFMDSILESGLTIKKCQRCNNFFVSKHENEKYCGRFIGDDTYRCKDVNNVENKKKPPTGIALLIKQTRNYLYNYAKSHSYSSSTNAKYLELYETFNEEIKRKKDDYRMDVITKKEFKKWLDKQKVSKRTMESKKASDER